VIRFLWLCLLADLRGFACRWPRRPREPAGCSVVSCACARGDVWGFYRLGWLPFCFQTAADGGVARTFLVRNTPEEDEYDRLVTESLVRSAEDRDAEDRVALRLDEYYPLFSDAVDRIVSRPLVPDYETEAN